MNRDFSVIQQFVLGLLVQKRDSAMDGICDACASSITAFVDVYNNHTLVIIVSK